MNCVNADLLRVLATLHGLGGDGVVSVRAGEGRRVLHISRGFLDSTESNFRSERLGDVLAAQGKLDPALIEPVAAEANRRGCLLGTQLLSDRLLTADELVAALGRQSLLRFEHALSMAGDVEIDRKAKVQPVLHQPVGGLIVMAFREKLPLIAVEEFLARRRGEPSHGGLGADPLGRLELHPAELRICRRLLAGESLQRVRARPGGADLAARMAGALVALELWPPGRSALGEAPPVTTYTWG